MMKGILILLLLGIVILTVFIYVGEDKKAFVQESEPAVSEEMTAVEDKTPAPESEKESKLERMQTRYAILKEARKELKLTLSRLGSRLRKAEFTPEKAEETTRLMRKANHSLKNPKLLGAFSSVSEIDHELNKIQSFQKRLLEIRESLDH